MTNKVLQYVLENSAEFTAKTAQKIQELEEEMKGAEGKEKKAALDKFLMGEVEKAIKAWDIPQVPNVIEDAYVDPMTIKLINSYIPMFSQGVYNVVLKGLIKVGDAFENVSDKLESAQ